MVDLILQYGICAFELFLLILFFLLVFFRGRHKRHRPIPRTILPIISSYQYHICVAWIALFFSSVFLFTQNDQNAHQLGCIWFAMSFGAEIVDLTYFLTWRPLQLQDKQLRLITNFF